MPAWRVDARDRTVRQYDVVASDGPDRNFIAHVALAADEAPRSVNAQTATLSCWHMGPPLGPDAGQADAIGTLHDDVVGLSRGQLLQIRVFVHDRLNERQAQEERLKRLSLVERYCAEYVILPAYLEPTAEVSLWRFSCAGFVLRAYEEANIRLIDQADLPTVALDELTRAYPRFGRILAKEEVRRELGIGDGDGWPVLLAGYLLHALSRSRAEIVETPYRPVLEDARFPH